MTRWSVPVERVVRQVGIVTIDVEAGDDPTVMACKHAKIIGVDDGWTCAGLVSGPSPDGQRCISPLPDPVKEHK